MDVQRLVCGQRPRRRRPDYGVTTLVDLRAESARELFRFEKSETNVDGRILAVLVLDFRFCERGAAVEAPVHRLETTVNVALFEELAEHANLRSEERRVGKEWRS